MASGYQGRILPTDLSTRTTARDEPDEHFNREVHGQMVDPRVLPAERSMRQESIRSGCGTRP